MKNLNPYTYKRVGTSNTYIIELHDEQFMTMENTSKMYITKYIGLLNGAFMEGVIHGSLYPVSNS